MRYSRTASLEREERREQWLRARAATQTLREAFPAIEQIRVELKFDDDSAEPPAAQSHVIHPPARAFFAFLCPFADCSGTFDLAAVAALVTGGSKPQAKGTLECQGVRARDQVAKAPCKMRLHYVLKAQYYGTSAG